MSRNLSMFRPQAGGEVDVVGLNQPAEKRLCEG